MTRHPSPPRKPLLKLAITWALTMGLAACWPVPTAHPQPSPSANRIPGTPTIQSTFATLPAATPDFGAPTLEPVILDESNRPSGRIIFTCAPEAYRQLCLIGADGSGYERLTHQPANDQDPALSPDGRRVVFVSDLDGYSEIYLRDLTSGEERRLTDRLGQVSGPHFSPDGGRVAFAHRPAGEDWSIWTMLVYDSLARPAGEFHGRALAPVWSPNGNWIAFAGVSGGITELYALPFDGGPARQVTRGAAGIEGGPDWAPDGEWLVFSAGRRGERDIYLAAVETGVIQRLTFGGNNLGPDFSPDGNWITFSSSRDGDHEIFVMRSDGSQVTQLTLNSFDDWQPNWGQ